MINGRTERGFGGGRSEACQEAVALSGSRIAPLFPRLIYLGGGRRATLKEERDRRHRQKSSSPAQFSRSREQRKNIFRLAVSPARKFTEPRRERGLKGGKAETKKSSKGRSERGHFRGQKGPREWEQQYRSRSTAKEGGNKKGGRKEGGESKTARWSDRE